MHASLAESLENLKPGLLWVARDGTVRYANGEGTARTGLATGRRLHDPDLLRAVAAAIVGRVPRQVATVGVSDIGKDVAQELRCRVIPGLASDDAFVLIGHDVTHDDGVGYDSLMQVIRADVRDPLRDAEKALSLWESQGTGGPELATMAQRLRALLGVVDRLVDLASIWDCSALQATDRIELWPLLQHAWAGVEPLALQRAVRVRFRAQTEAGALAILYGSEHWLGRVFEECLEAAVRSARCGATLDIEHCQMGTSAMVIFHDCDVFVPPEVHDGGTPLGAASGAAPRTGLSARDQLGLNLCRHILSLHGGQLHEEEEDGVRNFVIELPTGAPHHDDQNQLAVAQAQRYASDLAALKLRARTHGRAPARSNPA